MLELIAKDHLNGHAPVIMAIFGNVPIMSKKGGNILKIQVIFRISRGLQGVITT